MCPRPELPDSSVLTVLRGCSSCSLCKPKCHPALSGTTGTGLSPFLHPRVSPVRPIASQQMASTPCQCTQQQQRSSAFSRAAPLFSQAALVPLQEMVGCGATQMPCSVLMVSSCTSSQEVIPRLKKKKKKTKNGASSGKLLPGAPYANWVLASALPNPVEKPQTRSA